MDNYYIGEGRAMNALIILAIITGISWIFCIIKAITTKGLDKAKYLIAMLFFAGILIILLEMMKTLL
jgi:hypothetical protein